MNALTTHEYYLLFLLKVKKYILPYYFMWKFTQYMKHIILNQN
jgi:hypothetical protein